MLLVLVHVHFTRRLFLVKSSIPSMQNGLKRVLGTFADLREIVGESYSVLVGLAHSSLHFFKPTGPKVGQAILLRSCLRLL